MDAIQNMPETLVPNGNKLVKDTAIPVAEAGKERFAGLDFLRGIAILGVFGFHVLLELNEGPGAHAAGSWGSWLTYPFRFGRWGVGLFFVISGFCIHWSYLQWRQKHPGSNFWPQYFVRRFYRIYPPYLASLVIFVAIGAVFLRPRNMPGMQNMILHLSLLFNFDEHALFQINGSYWSLAVEWQLYLVYPLFLLLVRNLGFSWFLLLSGVIPILLPVVWQAVHGSALPAWVVFLPFFYWFVWGLGALVAERHFHGGCLELRPRYLFWLLVPVPFVAFNFQTVNWLVQPAIATVFALWVSRVLTDKSSGRSPAWRIVSGIGVISYSMYLIHQPLIIYFFRVFGKDSAGVAAWGTTACFLMIAGLSFLAWRFIELPAQIAGKMAATKLRVES